MFCRTASLALCLGCSKIFFQNQGFCSYKIVLIKKECNFAKANDKSLSNDDCYNEEESISENGAEERYLFSSDSEKNNNEKKNW